ncbi:MAG TPA: Maf family protein [Chthonomonadales bacterium]|nr:Maf family protein [Chthonomonadales bacterium]
MPKRLILASASPRRRELLALLGLPFEVVPSLIPEDEAQDLPPHVLVETLAQEKALDVWHRQQDKEDILILGADTVVVTYRSGTPTILGKPHDADDARRILQMLSGTAHTVYTGLALAKWSPECSEVDVQSKVVATRVVFRELTPALIDAYIATGEPFDKAGAYGIQGLAAAFVEAIYGDYFNVVGLPVQTVARMLEGLGIEWWRGAETLG